MENTFFVHFRPDDVSVIVSAGTTIAAAAKRAGVFLDAPCGGNGTCKKCAVLLKTAGETKSVLACQTPVTTNCFVTIPSDSSLAALGEGASRAISFAPYPEAKTNLDDACFAAFDLGTTTVVCYLLDAKTGEQLAVRGAQNPQSSFGADVIARASHALDHGGEALRQCALDALNGLLLSACSAANRKPEQVVLASIVGNTVMQHLLLGYPVESLVRAPYVPFLSDLRILPAPELGLTAHETCMVLLPPVIGGFVGADTVGCLSATAFDTLETPTLMIDIGTNGELALTDGKRIVSCSTAAGPAFEGANISRGMRASSGAIEHVWLEHGVLAIKTIGDAPPLGICGSGLIELAALLSGEDVIEEGGRLAKNGILDERIVTDETGMRAFVVTEHGADGKPILLTQKDVRELQLGKAAMRAGVETLLDALSLDASHIKKTFLAGAFGSHLSPSALCGIGLLPKELEACTESIGNAAGEGAKLYLRNFELFLQTEELAKETGYIELTLDKGFTDRYVDAMSFPREDQ
ncbi:MAG: ASKHA domain-containing protein [Clostridiaceae bacterium]